MYSCSSIRNNVQFKTYLPLLPPDVRDSSAVVYGPTFSCPSMSGPPAAPNPLSLVCSLEPLFSQERCIHRRNDPALCYRHSELVCITSKNTSHHITPHITSHITSQNITTLRTFCCKMCTQGNETSLCSYSREQTKNFLKSR